MQSSEAAGFLGKSVEDLYGRQVGVVVGFTLRTNGEVESIGLDHGSGSFSEVKAARLHLHEQALIVVPAWKADLTRIVGESEVLKKRIAALLELERDSKGSGASTAQYEQLRAQYQARVAKTGESNERLLLDVRGRVAELDQQDEAVDRFLVNASIQFRSGEISEATFGAMNEQCTTMKARNRREREELMAALPALARDEARPVEVRVPVSG